MSHMILVWCQIGKGVYADGGVSQVLCKVIAIVFVLSTSTAEDSRRTLCITGQNHDCLVRAEMSYHNIDILVDMGRNHSCYLPCNDLEALRHELSEVH